MNELNISSDGPQTKMPELQDFADYRDFISERLNFEKQRNPRLSFHYFAQKMKISSSFLSMLLAKKKHGSLESLSQISKYFSLGRHDRAMLIFGLLAETSDEGQDKELFEIIVKQIRAYKEMGIDYPQIPMSELNTLHLSELSMVLSVLAQTPGFKNDIDWVMERLLIKPESRDQVVNALNQIRSVHEKYSITESTPLVSGTLPTDLSGSVYQPAWLLHGKVIEDSKNFKPSTLASLTFSFDEEGANEAQLEYRRFLKKLGEIAEKSEVSDRVFIYSGGLFCVARPPEKSQDKVPDQKIKSVDH